MYYNLLQNWQKPFTVELYQDKLVLPSCFTSRNYFAPSSGTYYCDQRVRLSARVSQKPCRMYPNFTKLSRIGRDSVGYAVTDSASRDSYLVDV